MPAIWFAIMKGTDSGPEPIIEADTQEVLTMLYEELHKELQTRGFGDEKASIVLEAFVASFMNSIKSFKKRTNRI